MVLSVPKSIKNAMFDKIRFDTAPASFGSPGRPGSGGPGGAGGQGGDGSGFCNGGQGGSSGSPGSSGGILASPRIDCAAPVLQIVSY